jgi:hypothetical protein
MFQAFDDKNILEGTLAFFVIAIIVKVVVGALYITSTAYAFQLSDEAEKISTDPQIETKVGLVKFGAVVLGLTGSWMLLSALILVFTRIKLTA